MLLRNPRTIHPVLLAAIALLALPVFAQAQTFSSSPAASIPDGPSDGIQQSIVVSGGPTDIASLLVTIDISHTWDSDLSVWLLPPGVSWPGAFNATQRSAAIVAGAIELFNNIGGSGEDFTSTAFTTPGDVFDPGTTLIPDDSAQAPFTGTWYPRDIGALGALYGGDSNGTWSLVIYDDVSADAGTLNSWSLQIGQASGGGGGGGGGGGSSTPDVRVGNGCHAGINGSPVAILWILALFVGLVAIRRHAA